VSEQQCSKTYKFYGVILFKWVFDIPFEACCALLRTWLSCGALLCFEGNYRWSVWVDEPLHLEYMTVPIYIKME